MTYLDYIVFFEKRDRQQPKGFSGNATRLYLKLLAIANEIGWPEEFFKADAYVAAVCGLALNTMKECREKLVAGGLLAGNWGEKGRGTTGVYRLLIDEKKLSNSDSLPADNVSSSDSLTANKLSNSDSLPTENDKKLSEKLSNFDTLYIDKDKEVVEAADAAPPLSSLPVKKPGAKKSKAKGATYEQIAALPLPFTGAEFATIWCTFYTTNTKQAGKNLSAFELMLKKLGKYPEAFAVLMLERAIMGNWQGVENDGTARGLAEWLAEQARCPTPAVAPVPEASPAPEMNEEFLAQQRAREEAAQNEHFAKYATA